MYDSHRHALGSSIGRDVLGRCIALTDDELVAGFESATLSSDAFRHADHVRLAWIYLRRMPLLKAIRTYRDGLRRFATAQGSAARYHETVTWAFLILINERLHAAGAGGKDLAWAEFASRNPDLMRWEDGALFQYYDPDVLKSEVARRIFVLPGPVLRPELNDPSIATDP